MIPLKIQIQIIVFSIIYGIFLFIVFNMSKKVIYCQSVFLRCINTLSFTLLLALLYFFCLEILVDGIFHIYSLLVIYLSFYLCTFIANHIKKWYYDIGDDMAKRRRPMTQAAKTRLIVFGPLSLVAIFYFGFSLLKYSTNLYKLTKEKESLESQYLQLQEDADDLKNEITKLQDPEYLAKFARENYLYSKDGELIIKINETKEVLDDTQEEIENSQSIITISVSIIVLIFIYIIFRSIKKKKSDNWFLFSMLLILLVSLFLLLFL